jgi:hypothetical protein
MEFLKPLKNWSRIPTGIPSGIPFDTCSGSTSRMLPLVSEFKRKVIHCRRTRHQVFFFRGTCVPDRRRWGGVGGYRIFGRRFHFRTRFEKIVSPVDIESSKKLRQHPTPSASNHSARHCVARNLKSINP